MRRSSGPFALVPFVLLVTGCDRGPKTELTDPAPTATATATTTATASASAAPEPSAAPPPSDTEGPAKVTPESTKPPSTKHKLGDVVTLEGVFHPAEEDARKENDESACADPIRLVYPIKVTKEDGKPADDGDADRVCVWHWTGLADADKKPRPHMLQRGSHVFVRGKLTPKIRPQHPKAIMLFDAVVVSASPPPTLARKGVLPEGQTYVYIRKVDTTTRTFTFDIAYLYYGEDGRRAATSRGAPFDDDTGWAVLNDSDQLRTAVVPKTVEMKRFKYEGGGAWVPLTIEELARQADEHEAKMRAGKLELGRGFYVTVTKGVVTALSEVNLR